jgi:plastocyanin
MRTTIGVKIYIKIFFIFSILFSFLPAKAGWQVDLSRRMKSGPGTEVIAEEDKEKKKPEDDIGFFDYIVGEGAAQEIVVLNTEKGFIPSTVRVKVGNRYQLHVVNINEKEKNVSFILDAFSEHHGTYYGKIKTVTIEPKKEGIYSYQCPETAIEGKLIVFSGPTSNLRRPASN